MNGYRSITLLIVSALAAVLLTMMAPCEAQAATTTSISKCTITVANQGYTGTARTPAPTVKLGTKTLRKNTDYTVTYKNNVKVGTATVTVTGKGSYRSSKSANFKIVAKTPMTKATVAAIPSRAYSAKAYSPKPTVKMGAKLLREGRDYTLSYANNVKAGTATVTITGKNLYSGNKAVSFKITRASIGKTAVSSIGAKSYAGKALTPQPTVKLGTVTLKNGTDYTLSYKNNVKMGTATVTITGKGNLSGTRTTSFRINRASIANASVSSISSQPYTSKALTPQPVVKLGAVTLKKGTDYTLSYKNNVKPGTATITITGKGSVGGSRTAKFTVARASLASSSVASIPAKTYTGNAFTPQPAVKMGSTVLKKDTDYTLAYSNNTAAGTATVTITGKGNYTASKKVTFKISPSNISQATVSSVPAQTWTGSALSPEPTVKMGSTVLKKGRDYTLAYSDNIERGQATITITGKGNYTGEKSVCFEIKMPSLDGLSVSRNSDTGYVSFGASAGKFNAVFSYGDALDVEFSNGSKLEHIPYYNGFYAPLGEFLVLNYLGTSNPIVATNYGEPVWETMGLHSGDTVTFRLAERGAYSDIQDALNITYSDNRGDYPSDAAFANFRQLASDSITGSFYRSASPVNNWKKRAGYASRLAQEAGIACILDLSDSREDIEKNIGYNHGSNTDTSYFESLYESGNVIAIHMNSSYSTEDYRTKLVSGLSQLAHKDGPYLVHCVEGKDRTGFTCLVLEALAGSTYDEMLADYMGTYANYCGITAEGTPVKYQAVRSVCFDSMIGFLERYGDEGAYAACARNYLETGGMSPDDIDLLVSKLAG